MIGTKRGRRKREVRRELLAYFEDFIIFPINNHDILKISHFNLAEWYGNSPANTFKSCNYDHLTKQIRESFRKESPHYT